MSRAFISLIEQVAPLSSGLREKLEKVLVIRNLERGAILLHEGEICNTAYFLVKGTARLYYKIKDKEITNRFLVGGMVAISYYSYFAQKPSFENLHLLEDCTFEVTSREVFESLYVQFPELHNIMRLILERGYIESEERAMILRRLSAKERYEILLTKFPHIFQKASTEQIASFLGISRETLSRIRSGAVKSKTKLSL
jgi:CRP-like cAMP-binding protein